ncbi:transposase [Streptomyces sp. NBC_01426]|uniref:transposase n=1 Tax=Streptomyces sp. NBC_01426 TaxID=2975866 RepID=UPI002E30D368|nr:transposase [Streptomyces sp. NBC_01426]
MSDAEWAVVPATAAGAGPAAGPGRGGAGRAGAGRAGPGRVGAGRGGQPEAYCHRAMPDAIRYLVDNGTKWRSMPADFPPWDRTYAFFRRWRNHDLVHEFHDRL